MTPFLWLKAKFIQVDGNNAMKANGVVFARVLDLHFRVIVHFL